MSTSAAPRSWDEIGIDLYTAKHGLLTDKQIEALSQRTRPPQLSDRWREVPEAIKFSRRALQVAALKAHIESTNHEGDWKSDWERGRDLAKSADNSVAKFFEYLRLGKIPESPREIEEPLRQAVLHKMRSEGSEDISIERIQGIAKTQAETLWDAQGILSMFSTHCEERRQNIALNRQNRGDAEKSAFVYTLAEGWVWLTGQCPGKSPYPEKNPFLRFVKDAWTDAGQKDHEDETSFVSSLRTAIKQLECPSNVGSRRTNLALLQASGPSWQ